MAVDTHTQLEATSKGEQAARERLRQPVTHPGDIRSELLVKLALLSRVNSDSSDLLRSNMRSSLQLLMRLRRRCIAQQDLTAFWLQCLRSSRCAKGERHLSDYRRQHGHRRAGQPFRLALLGGSESSASTSSPSAPGTYGPVSARTSRSSGQGW
jgi:hypothetical protein